MKKIFLIIANDLRIILAIYAVSLLIAAQLFHILEGRSFVDGLWWACVTALTIGYGDLSPATASGRFMAQIFSHFWIFGVAPMIIGNIISNILQDKQKFTHEEQEWTEHGIKEIAKALKITLPPSPRDF